MRRTAQSARFLEHIERSRDCAFWNVSTDVPENLCGTHRALLTGFFLEPVDGRFRVTSWNDV
jgi:hypothetical protein